MWIAIARIPPPDAAYWPGRRLLGVVDAIIWPALWFGAIQALPVRTGLMGTVIQTFLIMFALRRATSRSFGMSAIGSRRGVGVCRSRHSSRWAR